MKQRVGLTDLEKLVDGFPATLGVSIIVNHDNAPLHNAFIEGLKAEPGPFVPVGVQAEKRDWAHSPPFGRQRLVEQAPMEVEPLYRVADPPFQEITARIVGTLIVGLEQRARFQVGE
jgi:hypothetical protein